MTRLRIALISLAIFLLAPQVNLAQSSSEATAKPNIIFILADDQSWNGTSVQMHPDIPTSKSDFYRTPQIEKLAQRGMRFSQAYSPGPMCTPTRASLQTGKSPAQLRMTNVGRGRRATPSQRFIVPPHSTTLSPDETTIGETLRDAGYATAWFGKWHLGGNAGPAAHGYDESDGPTGNANGNTKDPNNPKDIFGITQRGMRFIAKNAKRKKPFYLQLWHYAVHSAVQSRDETEQAYTARPPGKTHRSTSFAGMTEDLDTGVGMILDLVEELSISDNTYVIYMSDHGAGQNLSPNAPLNHGKGTLWEGGMRVPLIVSGPGVKSGGYCNVPTVGWDLFPTFCDLAGLDRPLPQGVEGVSLKPLLKTGRGDLHRPGNAIAFHFPHYSQGAPHSTITMDGLKLIKFYDPAELRLFDLNKDIGEQHNLAKVEPDKTARLHQRLNEYLKTVNAGMPSLNPNFDPNAIVQTNGRRARRGTAARGGPRQAQIAERQKALSNLQEALQQQDMKKVGQLITNMKKALENAPRRPRGPRSARADGASRRQQRQEELQQLEAAHKDADTEKLAELIAEIKRRMENTPARPSSRGGAQRDTGRTEPGRSESGSDTEGNSPDNR